MPSLPAQRRRALSPPLAFPVAPPPVGTSKSSPANPNPQSHLPASAPLLKRAPPCRRPGHSSTRTRKKSLYPPRLPLLDIYQARSGRRKAAAMSAVNITNVAVLDNPTAFLNPFQFEISYECLVPLDDDLEWKLTYVGSAEDETYDQQLESVLVGPVNVGTYRFVFQADPPDPLKIREEDIIGVTVLLLTCSYVGQEFMRVGYYVNNDYDDEQLREEPPAKLLLDRVQRNILADKPRVTKFPINFHPEPGTSAEQPQQDADQQQQPASPEQPPVEPQKVPLENGTGGDEIKPAASDL